MDRLHELSEWECEVCYHDGYAAGYAAANAEFLAALQFALGGRKTRTLREAANIHHRTVVARRLREEADRREPRPGDYLGGPIDFERGQGS